MYTCDCRFSFVLRSPISLKTTYNMALSNVPDLHVLYLLVNLLYSKQCIKTNKLNAHLFYMVAHMYIRMRYVLIPETLIYF